MNLVTVLLVGLGVLWVTRKGHTTEAPAIKDRPWYGLRELQPIYESTAALYGLDWRLLRAIALTESSEDPYAVNPSDPSYGLFQILYTGSNKFNIKGWPPENAEALFDPSYNASLAAQILGWNISTYGLKKGIAVYNNWSARNDPTDGPFRNQGYVDKVLSNYSIAKMAADFV